MYLCGFNSSYSLIIKNQVIFDKNIPAKTFCFICRCCDNKIILEWSNGEAQMTQNYGTPEIKYKTIS